MAGLQRRAGGGLGLANAALEDGATVLEHARDAARRFLHLAPSAVVESKRLMKAPFIEELRRVIAEEGDIFSTRLRSPEAIEALSAFMPAPAGFLQVRLSTPLLGQRATIRRADNAPGVIRRDAAETADNRVAVIRPTPR